MEREYIGEIYVWKENNEKGMRHEKRKDKYLVGKEIGKEFG